MHALEKPFLYIFSFIPVSPGVILPWLVTIFVAFTCWVITRNLSAKKPSAPQVLLEEIHKGLLDFIQTIVGEKYLARLTPVLSTIFIYIFLSNLMGIIPGLKSPTGLFSNCLGLSLIIFFLTLFMGIKTHGFGYIKHFTGPVWWMVPIMLPIHIIGEFAKPISLTLRLFGNIMGEDVVILVLTIYVFPLLVPIPMLLMAIFTSLLQALVFTILSGVYLSNALEDSH